MRRWGYITIDGTARKIHKGRPGPDAVLRATAAGLRAREVWLPLPGLIEKRWRERFGVGQIDRLRESLATVVSQLDPGLPDCLPILGAALLSRGRQAQRLYHEFVGTIEQGWRQRFTGSAIDGLRASLETLAAAPDGEPPPLFRGLEPYPDNWRAAVRRPSILPHYPMILHRGGYPDGS